MNWVAILRHASVVYTLPIVVNIWGQVISRVIPTKVVKVLMGLNGPNSAQRVVNGPQNAGLHFAALSRGAYRP